VRAVVFRGTIREVMLQGGSDHETMGGGPGGRFRAAYRVLEDAISAGAFPGCAFGVLSGRQVQVQDALGHFTYEDGAPRVVLDTVFDIASVTKVVATTATAMLLVQRGRLNIDSLLGDLLPAFVEWRGHDDAARRVTLRHLLAHNSGLPGYVEFFRSARTRDSLLSHCMKLELEVEPETRVDYSDPGFILLGEALRACINEPLDHWVAREIHRPAGMLATTFCPASTDYTKIPPTEEDRNFRKRRIQGEVQDENAWVLGGVAGHAGLFSNVPDLIRFSAAILGAISGEEGLFHFATLDLFSKRQLPAGSSRALGWDTPSQKSSSGRYFSERSIGHLGYSGCSLWIDLESAVAVVLLTNRTWPDRASQLIRQVRPAFHDAIREAL
jgi:serine-type D-Ala-D-Ala carboxypeptidase